MLDYLNKEISKNLKPTRPDDKFSPFTRVFDDGAAYEADRILKWIESRSKPSPDGAQNTED